MALTVTGLAAVWGSVLMTLRASYRAEQYVEMEAESRKCLELFGQDVRMAQSISWLSSTSIKLTIPKDDVETTTNLDVITYSYVADTKSFTRTDTSGAVTTLLANVESFYLMGYTSLGTATHSASSPPSDFGTVNNSTKQLQLSVSSTRTRGQDVRSSQKILSARFILRNKRVAT